MISRNKTVSTKTEPIAEPLIVSFNELKIGNLYKMYYIEEDGRKIPIPLFDAWYADDNNEVFYEFKGEMIGVDTPMMFLGSKTNVIVRGVFGNPINFNIIHEILVKNKIHWFGNEFIHIIQFEPIQKLPINLS